MHSIQSKNIFVKNMLIFEFPVKEKELKSLGIIVQTMRIPGHIEIKRSMSHLSVNAITDKQELRMKQGLGKVSHSLPILYFF